MEEVPCRSLLPPGSVHAPVARPVTVHGNIRFPEMAGRGFLCRVLLPLLPLCPKSAFSGDAAAFQGRFQGKEDVPSMQKREKAIPEVPLFIFITGNNKREPSRNGRNMLRRNKTKGQLEAEIGTAITHFEKEYMGRGPLEIKTHILNDMIIVRLRVIFNMAEQNLIKNPHDSQGRRLLKQVRLQLIENGRSMLETAVKNITRCKVKSLHTDLSTVSGEKIIVFILDRPPEYD
jgi:uncharacterized protein YbcI